MISEMRGVTRGGSKSNERPLAFGDAASVLDLPGVLLYIEFEYMLFYFARPVAEFRRTSLNMSGV